MYFKHMTYIIPLANMRYNPTTKQSIFDCNSLAACDLSVIALHFNSHDNENTFCKPVARAGLYLLFIKEQCLHLIQSNHVIYLLQCTIKRKHMPGRDYFTHSRS